MGSEHTSCYAFAAQRPSDALALGRRRLPHVLATCEGGMAAAAAAESLGAELVALEDRAPVRRPWSNADLASVVGLLDASSDERRALLCYATGSRVEAEARRRGYSLAGPDGRLKQTLDGKRVARQLFVDSGLPTVPWIVCSRTALDFRALAARLGDPFVLQTDRGSAGRGTYVAREPSDVAAICDDLPDDVRLVASPLLHGVTLNVHGVVAHGRVAAGRASIQVTGVADLTDLEFGYCGNDFGAAMSLSPALLHRARELSLTVAAALRARGWIGIFGLDVLVSAGDLLPLEINPRFQGSSWLLAEVQQALGESLIGELHRAAVLGEEPPTGAPRPRLDSPNGAFLILHQRGGPTTLPTTPDTGIYRMDGARLRFVRGGIGVLDCASDEIYVEGFPPAGHIVERGAVLARLASWQRLVECDGRTLTTIGAALVHQVGGLVNAGAPAAA